MTTTTSATMTTLMAHAAVEGMAIELARYVVMAGGVAAGLRLCRRWTAARRIQPRHATSADWRREIGHSLQTIVIFALSTMATVALNHNGMLPITMHAPGIGIAVLEFVAIVVAHDAYFYWMHRGLHTRALFRRAHLLHHKSRSPTPFAAYSFAPLEAVAESLFLPLFLLIVPFHAPVVVAFLLHQMARNVLGHSGHELLWSGFTDHPATRWLTTTTHHDLHHSEGRYNYGLYFTWWDRMMGTEHPQYHARFEAAVAKPSATPAPAE